MNKETLQEQSNGAKNVTTSRQILNETKGSDSNTKRRSKRIRSFVSLTYK